MLKLTMLNGGELYIKMLAIDAFRPPISGAERGGAVVIFGGHEYQVRQTVAEIYAILHGEAKA